MHASVGTECSLLNAEKAREDGRREMKRGRRGRGTGELAEEESAHTMVASCRAMREASSATSTLRVFPFLLGDINSTYGWRVMRVVM